MRRTHDIASFFSFFFCFVVFYPSPPSDPHGSTCYCCTVVASTLHAPHLRYILSQKLQYYARESPLFGLCAAWCNGLTLPGLLRNAFSVGMHVSRSFPFFFCILFAFCLQFALCFFCAPYVIFLSILSRSRSLQAGVRGCRVRTTTLKHISCP